MSPLLRVRYAVAVLALSLVTCRQGGDRVPTVLAPSPPPPAPAAASTPCGLPPSTWSGEECPRESPTYMAAVEQAIDRTVAEHPEMVNTQRVRGCGNCYQVLDTHNFPEEVGRNLEKMGFCTIYDGEELGVKRHTNAFNDQYDILLAEGYIRREPIGSYRSTCYPAWF